jgi:hypothetical protein
LLPAIDPVSPARLQNIQRDTGVLPTRAGRLFARTLFLDGCHPRRDGKPSVTDQSSCETAGWLAVVGLGPGDPEWQLPQAREVLSRATDLVGYQTYLDMLPPELRATQTLYGAELARARHALDLPTSGRRVAVVSSGDPGVFAMASAVFEAQSAEDAMMTKLSPSEI